MDSIWTISDYVIHHLWSVSWQVTILAAIIWLVDRLSFRATPLFRYWLWMIVLVRLCIPVSIELPTGIDTSFINRLGKNVADFRYRHIPVYETGDKKLTPNVLPIPEQSDNTPSVVYNTRNYSPSMTTTHKVFFIWYGIFIVICIYIAARTIAIIRRLKYCKSVEKPELKNLLGNLSRSMGIKRPVKLLYMDNDIGDVPSVIGIFRRGILLPRTIMDEWSAEDLKPILLHELAHIKRMDLMINLLQLVVKAVYFFHPVVWYVNRQILLYREEVCDDIAVQALDGRRKQYTLSMLRVMENALHEPALGLVGIGFTERESTVKRRISRILCDTYRIKTRLSLISLAGLILIGTTGFCLSCKKSEKDYGTVKIPREQRELITIEISGKGKYYVNGIQTPIDSLGTLIEKLQRERNTLKRKPIGIQYDHDVTIQEYNKILKILQDTDIKYSERTTLKPEKENKLIVEINSEGNIVINGSPVTYESFEAYLAQERHTLSQPVTVLIKADFNTSHGDILKLMRMARSQQIDSFEIDGENEKLKSSKASEIQVGTGTTIKKGTDRVLLNGNPLIRGTDYQIDYKTGKIWLLNERAMYPEADLVIKYEEESNYKKEKLTRQEQEEVALKISKELENHILSDGKKESSNSSEQLNNNSKPKTSQEEAANINTPIYISLGWGHQLRPPDELKRSVINLVEAVNRYTVIDAKIDIHMSLDAPALFETPIVLITSDKAFNLTQKERENFGKYLRNGGFAFIDNSSPQYEFGEAETSLRQMLRDILGADFKLLPIPDDHELYHCYFDFDDGAPSGSDYMMIQEAKEKGDDEEKIAHPASYIEGIWLGSRLVAIYSDKGYFHRWNDPEHSEPQIKFGVNVIVFALKQKGGIGQE